LHRFLTRHAVSCLQDVEGDKTQRQRIKRYPIGYLRMDIAEGQMDEGKL